MQLGDGVGPAGQPQPEHGHVERGAGRLIGKVAERHQPVDIDAALARPAAEVLLHQLPREAVDAGRHWCVGGEDPTGPHAGEGVVERHAVVGDRPPDAFEHQEPGVTLVAVEHVGVDTELGEQTDPADA